MKKTGIILFTLFCFGNLFSQEIIGDELLAKAIKFHDPNNNWETFKGELFVTMETPKNGDRVSKIIINLPKQYFSVTAKRDTIITEYIVDKKEIRFSLNGDRNPLEELKKKYSLNAERANLYKSYYTYLYGLPMKLKDEGTVIHQKVERKNFKGKEYLVLKATYNKEIGKDTWYFYFNPKTYEMKVYQFFKATKDSGEYILLSGLKTINEIKMPKVRAWYYNKDNTYLGTDILLKKE